MGGWTTPFCVNSTLPAGSRRYIFSHDSGEKTAPENSFQPGKKFRLHGIGPTTQKRNSYRNPDVKTPCFAYPLCEAEGRETQVFRKGSRGTWQLVHVCA